MSEIDNYIVKSVEEIKSDVKNIYTRLDVITQDLYNYKNQRYKCLMECDMRYIKLTDIEGIFKRELDKYFDQRMTSTHKKTEVIKNIINILTTLAPYMAMLGTYLLLTK